ncbi:xanthine dehydrogenase family protein molybdopterin-binding subunit [Fodinicola acaciae]|uniref:xanthine dehydrogenase family protein molybdopterin-binding subunit n=1 Tax=Fodinicola acaciae TaxID=2681555 RepID=UPI0013D4729B|nr:xanthine dehydrogenase family protein molybdopterin-binding subunit [Fodinicola acaciae]
MSILGTRVVRTEDPLFLTRGATYTDDLVDERLRGAAYVTFVRSPIAHGRITSIDTSAAAGAPGVVAVFTAADTEGDGGLSPLPPPLPMFTKGMDRPPFAKDTVRFVGDIIAAIVTEDRYQGEDAAELVDVDIDPLPAVVDPRKALDDEVLLFPEAGTNTIFTIPGEFDDSVFDDCDVVVTREIVNQRLAAAPMEVRASAAVWGEDGRLTTWISNQAAQMAKAALVAALAVDADKVRVITPDTGGGFGAKIGADLEVCLVAWIAGKIGRPLRWVETRSENLVGMTHGRDQVQTIKIGGNRDGKVLAYRLDVIQDSGAYPLFGALLPALTFSMATGVYAIDRLQFRSRSVATNKTSVAAYRGAGRPEAAAAIERAMDLFAAEIGMDPVEVRHRNLLPPEVFPYKTKGGSLYDSGDYAAALKMVTDEVDYPKLRQEQAERRARGDVVQLGIGVSVYVEVTGGGDESGAPKENATVEVHPDGTVTVLTGTSPHGQGHQTAWSMLVSDQLGIPLDRITVKYGDTDLIPEGGGTMGSRSLQQGGVAVHEATTELVQIAKARAAELLEANVDDLVVDTDRAAITVAGVPTTAITFAQLAEKEKLSVRKVFTAPGATFPFGAHIAIVEVDTESGKAELRRIVTVDDAGTILNPLLFDGQRHGGIAQGVAQALYEEVLYDDDGNPLTSTFAAYPFLSATEVPSFDLLRMQTPTPYNPLGAKGIGEAGTIGATPAVQNAVVDAVSHLGVRHIEMPTTPERVWTAIQDATGGQA